MNFPNQQFTRRAPLSFAPRVPTLRSAAFAFCCLFVFAIPWENAFLIQGVGTISRLLGLVAFPVGILAIAGSGKLRRLSTPMVLMSLFVVWGGVSYFWSVNSDATVSATFSWIQNLGMVWLIWELAQEKQKQLLLMRAYVLGTLISSGATALSYVSGSETTHYQRYAGSGFDPNDLGLLLALSLPISFYLATTERNIALAGTYRFQQLMAMVAIGLTSSRAALVAMIVALLYIPLALLKVTFRQKCTFVLLAMIAAGSLWNYLPETSWQRWQGIGTELQQGNMSTRKVIWSVGWEVFQEHPLRGVGAGGFPTASQRLLATPEVAHNTFLSILVEEGLVGLGLFTLLLLSLTLPALRLPALERNLWLVVLATWSTGVVTLTWENRKPTWFLLGLMAAWLAAKYPLPDMRPTQSMRWSTRSAQAPAFS